MEDKYEAPEGVTALYVFGVIALMAAATVILGMYYINHFGLVIGLAALIASVGVALLLIGWLAHIADRRAWVRTTMQNKFTR